MQVCAVEEQKKDRKLLSTRIVQRSYMTFKRLLLFKFLCKI